MHVTSEHCGTADYRKKERRFSHTPKDDFKEEIKRRLPFRDRYRKHYPDKYNEHGNSFCVWHEDTNHPDLQINDDKYFAKCHCCGVRVDIFDLEAKVRGLAVKNPRDFQRILSDLAAEAGVELPTSERPYQSPRSSEGRSADITYDYCDEKGQLQYQRFRQKGEKSFKYRRPDGRGRWIHTLYQVDPKTKRKTHKKAVKRLLYRLEQVVKAGLDEVIVLVEGEKDVHSAESLGFIATTAGSATDWLALVKDNGHLPLKGRKIWLIPDNDDAGEKLVDAIRETLALEADIRVLRLHALPEKGDLTDFVAYHGLEKARQVILDRGPVSDRLMPRLPMGKDFRPDEWGGFIATNFNIKFFNSGFFQYRNGVYIPVDDLHVENIIASLSDGQFKNQFQYNNVVAAIRRAGFKGVSEAVVDPMYILNLKNGLIDMRDEDPELRPHTPNVLTTIQLAVHYDADARCPLFDSFLEAKVTDPTLRQIVWEMIGYFLTPDTGFQVGFFIYGITSTGKSVLAKVIIGLLGTKRVSSLDVQALDKRFALSALVGTLVNISGDEDFKSIVPDGVIKKLITGDPIDVEKKYKDHFTWHPTTRFLALANKFPATSDVTEAFFRRWIVIPMNIQTLEADKILNLEERIIKDELPGILNRALFARYQLYKRGSFTKSEESERFKEQWRVETNAVKDWAQRRLIENPGGLEYLKHLFENYNLFISYTNRKSYLRDSEFKGRLESMGYEFSKLGGKNILRGYRLVPDGE